MRAFARSRRLTRASPAPDPPPRDHARERQDHRKVSPSAAATAAACRTAGRARPGAKCRAARRPAPATGPGSGPGRVPAVADDGIAQKISVADHDHALLASIRAGPDERQAQGQRAAALAARRVGRYLPFHRPVSFQLWAPVCSSASAVQPPARLERDGPREHGPGLRAGRRRDDPGSGRRRRPSAPPPRRPRRPVER